MCNNRSGYSCALGGLWSEAHEPREWDLKVGISIEFSDGGCPESTAAWIGVAMAIYGNGAERNDELELFRGYFLIGSVQIKHVS